ncbi:MAG: HDIG domain-containing protein [Prevotella sp.]|jgi:putative nucleotidyltransferase with HDIG domain|nr:HDIG domain-containing protein [Prevotella sp.]
MDADKNKKISIPMPLLFVVAAAVIIFFFPREGKFMYSYMEGKPWKYGLLTASFDFPVYKTEHLIEWERDSLLAGYQPYYTTDPAVEANAVSEFEKHVETNKITDEYRRYVIGKLTELYAAGIISPEDFDKINNTRSKQLRLLGKSNIAVARNIDSFFTPKSAYEKIINDIGVNLDANVIHNLNLNGFLYSNILYDDDKSTKAKDELMSKISPAQGMVQSGEKIIDRGELVTPRTFMILNSLKKVTEETADSKIQQGWLILGESLLTLVFIFSLMIYLRLFRPREYHNRKNVSFILLMITSFCVLTGITVNYGLFSIYIIPYAIPTIMIRTFIDSRTAMTTHAITALICSFMAPFPAEFLTLQIAAGYICIFSLKDLSERSQLIKSSFFILLTYVVAYIGYVLTLKAGFSQDKGFDSAREHWLMLLNFGINFIFVMFTYLLVYMCEKAFGFISGVSMIELSNTNKPLLQKFSEAAPGTFQHSIQVSNMASAVALKLGANASLVRTGALYHDIGKMTNPVFFTENQAPGMNPHAGLSYKESARIIISHVEEGVKIARKYNLPEQIIAFIVTHHGTGIAKFFYNSYKNEHPDEEVSTADFSYPGPNPFSRETAILMMADTLEAASHSLKEYTEDSISALVDRLIDAQLNDGLLKNAPITFRDVEIAKAIFKEKLMTIYHTRIAYPELKKTETSDADKKTT